MNPTEIQNAFRQATAAEPPMRLDADAVVTGGQARVRRRRALTTAGVAALSAAALAVPIGLWSGGGGAARQLPGAGASRTGPTILPTPGAPHGGCTDQNTSGSTAAAVLADWLIGQLPAGHPYHTDGDWQASYVTDCLDGAKADATTASVAMTDISGGVDIDTERNVPAQPVVKPCTPPRAPTTAVPTGSGGSGPGQIHDRCETHRRPDGSTLTIEESHYPVPHGNHTRMVVLWRADGTVVRLAEDNANRYGRQPLGAPLLLTIDQMVALVTGPDVLLYLPPAR